MEDKIEKRQESQRFHFDAMWWKISNFAQLWYRDGWIRQQFCAWKEILIFQNCCVNWINSVAKNSNNILLENGLLDMLLAVGRE